MLLSLGQQDSEVIIMKLSAKLTAKYFPYYFSFTYFYGKAYLRLTADREMTAPSRA